jgi:hypothetical protein
MLQRIGQHTWKSYNSTWTGSLFKWNDVPIFAEIIEGGLAATGVGAPEAAALEIAEDASTASKVGMLGKFFSKSKANQ